MLKIKIKEENLKKSSTELLLENTMNDKLSTIIRSNILENNLWDMEELQKRIVPIIKDCEIFISYSHGDEKLALNLANQLQNKGNKVFIDCYFWKDIDAYLKKYNDKYSKNQNGSYDYSKVNQAASSFYMILSDAIVETIGSAKIFISVIGKSTINDRTYSPWIYLENKIVSKRPNAKMKSKMDLLLNSICNHQKVSFPVINNEYIEAQSFQDILDIMDAYDWSDENES